MKVTSARYLGSYGYDQPLPPPLGPEFLFVGRSNVGKSSLINTLVGRRDLARTSNAPGKTQTANFYTVNDGIYFVDVPGYGYAKMSKANRARWRKHIASYLSGREALSGVVHLIDVRHRPGREDQAMAETLRGSARAVCVVFNKIDKVSRASLDRTIAGHLRELSVEATSAVVPFSSETGAGRRALWAWIEDHV